MKVALVSFYMMETTIPLARHLSLDGIDVDLYSLLPHNNQNTFVFDFLRNEQPDGFVDSKITRIIMGENLCNYLGNVKIKVFIFPDRPFDEYILKDMYFAYLLAKYIKIRKYDLIHIIHSDNRFWFFFNFFIRKEKIVQTLHEVTSHQANNSYPERRKLNLLIKKSTPIIFHSHTSRKRFIEYKQIFAKNQISDNNLVMIRFGLFETYKCFSKQSANPGNNGKINILNFGRIVPYKGIDLLIEAVKILQDKYPIHLIVAGEGIPYFNFDDIISYEFINRFISNEEIVNLIESCSMVVLPYTSASQSGVPMAVYSFCKPVVASNIAGFREVIDHLKTGILVDDLNGQAFASSIEMLLANYNIKADMEKNIKMKYSEGEFSWSSIADRTMTFYKKQFAKNNKDASQTIRILFEILFLQVRSISVNLKTSFLNKFNLLLIKKH
jgi:glycosyltransferase involved in cell wall biosynthesis